MNRFAIVLTVLIAILWQSVSGAAANPLANGWVDVEHASLHWQHTEHHHHDDGSFHVDDSEASAQHLVTDHLSASLAITAPTSHRFAPLASSAPRALHEAPMPHPPPDGLLRPPRLRS